MKGNWPKVEDVTISGKRVLVRVDLDVSDWKNPRVESAVKIVDKLLKMGAVKVKAIAHRGDISLVEQLKVQMPAAEWFDGLRDDPGEKENSEEYARKMTQGFDVYVNEAFATSHRVHASFVAMPKLIKLGGGQAAFGDRFVTELEKLQEIWNKAGRRILVAGGTKVEDKFGYAQKLEGKFDMLLLGGKIPEFAKSRPEILSAKYKLGNVRGDGLDLTEESILEFEEEIGRAEVILAAGVMGKYEDEAADEGTKRVLEAMARSSAYKVAGGGDIEVAISKYGLEKMFDWISVGGGAMLEYLATGTLTGMEAVITR